MQGEACILLSVQVDCYISNLETVKAECNGRASFGNELRSRCAYLMIVVE